jgi:peptidoglycan/xylan/chitin deacetylase (PgdA/CDA1 family)
MFTNSEKSFGILMYHRVSPRVDGVSRPTLNVTPGKFRRQMECLLSRGYTAVPLRQAVECCEAGKSLPARAFVITFDDGYEAVYRWAWPILKEFSIPATIFLATAYINGDRAFPFDEWDAVETSAVPPETWRPLSAAQCMEMAASGLMELASHTHAHGDFRGRAGDFRRDLEESLRILEKTFGVRRPTFAFPFGYHDDDLIAAAREAGVCCALNVEPRLARSSIDPFRWSRFLVTDDDNFMTIAMKLNGCYTAMWRVWTPLRRQWRKAQSLSRGSLRFAFRTIQ